MTEIDNPIYLDPSHSIAERVQDLLSRMTLPEKVVQMNHPTRGIERLGIAPYNYWSEGLHGVARNGRATVFPQAIGMAATWDPVLIKAIASAIGDEARAKHHEAIRRNGSSGWYQGLTFWSPNVNIFRDPRWGRGQETWGEDPFLTGELGSAFVRGLQGDHPKYIKTAACAKHFAVHSGPERERHTFDAQVSRRDLFATYLPAFKKLVTEAKVEAIMGAYNRTLGEPCCASYLLLDQILRGEWEFDGHVVSDCGALSDIHKNHRVTSDSAESAALALKAGCDLGCDCVYDEIPIAIERGLINEDDVNRALARTLTTRFRLGMFDPQEIVPFTSIPMSVVGCDTHRNLAHQAALESVILLKNKQNILPIGEKIKSILIVGPTASNLEVLLGNYYGLSDHLTSLLEGIIGNAPEGVKIEYRPGCLLNQPNGNPFDWSMAESSINDLTIACMGLSPLMEGEEGDAIMTTQNGDRTNIDLPPNQVVYLKQLAAAGARIVLVITGGSPIALGEVFDLVEAILFVWYPGQEGGNAVADLIFGRSSPSGKLPITFPKSLDDLPSFDDYSMKSRTYRYSTAEPLFPFGFGLSYTNFLYSNLEFSKTEIMSGESLQITLTLTNLGTIESDEVVQFYLSDLQASVPIPIHNLVGFQRVHLLPLENRGVKFTITPQMMMLFDNFGEQKLEPGQFRLTVGGCSPSTRGQTLGAPEPLCSDFVMLSK